MKNSMPKTRMTLAQVAKELDISISTAWRWALRGTKGRRLKSFLVGGRRYVYRCDLNDFLRPSGQSAEVPSHDAADESLRSGGM